MITQDSLSRILAGEVPSFAMMQRSSAHVDILIGDIDSVDALADVPLSDSQTASNKAQHDALVLVPHKQISERNFEAVDDDTPLLVLKVHEQSWASPSVMLDLLPNDPITLENTGFDISDKEYVDIVRDVLEQEIRNGAGSNFVIKRAFVAEIPDYSLSTALSLFRRLLYGEMGAYWTFIIHTGSRTLVGATPERHVSLKASHAVMNPISGTYRYPPDGLQLDDILTFLDDRKETEELYMVLDEELKMMAQICEGAGQVTGPFLREMAQLAHTEYYIEGKTHQDPRDILRETLLAPTVTGSPLKNACQVIARYEPKGRGYYGGIAALIGRDANGTRCMDSAILIRTADFTHSVSADRYKMAFSVGATLVRHSDAESEVAETRAKAAGVLRALEASPLTQEQHKSQHLKASLDPQIQKALSQRNDKISKFWFKATQNRAAHQPHLVGHRVLVVDAEDDFTEMLAAQLRALGLSVDLHSHSSEFQPDHYHLVVMGPGPGNPRDMTDPRMARMSQLTTNLLLSKRTPFLSVCLSHQLLCQQLGLKLQRRSSPNQGTQKDIKLFGVFRRVGFYNSFAAYSDANYIHRDAIGKVKIVRSQDTGEVHALMGPYFSSVQFHLESVLTETGPQILNDLLMPIMTARKVFAA